jgi:hypothetical protein
MWSSAWVNAIRPIWVFGCTIGRWEAHATWWAILTNLDTKGMEPEMKFALKDRSYSEIINGSFSLCEIRFRIDMLVTFSCVIRSSYDSLEINSISKIAMLLSDTTSYISNRCYLLRVASTVILVINKFIRATKKAFGNSEKRLGQTSNRVQTSRRHTRCHRPSELIQWRFHRLIGSSVARQLGTLATKIDRYIWQNYVDPQRLGRSSDFQLLCHRWPTLATWQLFVSAVRQLFTIAWHFGILAAAAW